MAGAILAQGFNSFLSTTSFVLSLTKTTGGGTGTGLLGAHSVHTLSNAFRLVAERGLANAFLRSARLPKSTDRQVYR